MPKPTKPNAMRLICDRCSNDGPISRHGIRDARRIARNHGWICDKKGDLCWQCVATLNMRY